MADLTFKNSPFKLQEGWKVHSTGESIGNFKYRPDISIKNSNGKFAYILESSSTNDRKVGLGELLLAEKLFIDEESKGTLVFSLCGVSTNSPRPDTQIEYIRPYFNFLKESNKDIGVVEIHFINEKEFKDAEWDVLSSKFNEYTLTLSI